MGLVDRPGREVDRDPGCGTPFRGPLVIHAGARKQQLHEAEAAWDRVGLRYDDLIATLYPARDRGADPLCLWVRSWQSSTSSTSSPIIDGSLRWTEDSDTPPAAVVVSWRSAAMLVDTRRSDRSPTSPTSCPTATTPGRFGPGSSTTPRVIDLLIPAARGNSALAYDPACASGLEAAHLDESPDEAAATLPVYRVPGTDYVLVDYGGLKGAGGGGAGAGERHRVTPCRYASTDELEV